MELHKNEEINLLIGQKGEAACLKSMSPQDDEACTVTQPPNYSTTPAKSKTHMVKNIYIENGAGGGGGATYVFLVRKFINCAKSDLFTNNFKIFRTMLQTPQFH